MRNALTKEYEDAREAHAQTFRTLQRAVNAPNVAPGGIHSLAEAEARAYLRLVRARNAVLDAEAPRRWDGRKPQGGASPQRHETLHAPAA